MSNSVLIESINIIIKNAERLYNGADFIFKNKDYSLANSLFILTYEEIGKASQYIWHYLSDGEYSLDFSECEQLFGENFLNRKLRGRHKKKQYLLDSMINLMDFEKSLPLIIISKKISKGLNLTNEERTFLDTMKTELSNKIMQRNADKNDGLYVEINPHSYEILNNPLVKFSETQVKEFKQEVKQRLIQCRNLFENINLIKSSFSQINQLSDMDSRKMGFELIGNSYQKCLEIIKDVNKMKSIINYLNLLERKKEQEIKLQNADDKQELRKGMEEIERKIEQFRKRENINEIIEDLKAITITQYAISLAQQLEQNPGIVEKLIEYLRMS